MLVEQGGAKIDIKDVVGATPLSLACGAGQREAALYLVNKGADVEVRVVCSIEKFLWAWQHWLAKCSQSCLPVFIGRGCGR